MSKFQFNLEKIKMILQKNWGFYLTNSCNRTLKKQFKTAICLEKKQEKFLLFW